MIILSSIVVMQGYIYRSLITMAGTGGVLHTLLDYRGFNLHELVFSLVAKLPASRRVSLSGFYFVCIGQVRVVLL